VKQTVEQILKETKFNQLDYFEHNWEEDQDESYEPDRQYYGVDLVWKEPKFYCNLRFTIALDQLTLDDAEVTENDDGRTKFPTDKISAQKCCPFSEILRFF
jgi:hypothetical protein